MALSITQVAKRAKVSIATVSRVINDSPRVDPKTREGIKKIIELMNYHPNLLARKFRQQRTNMIGVFLSYFSGIDSSIFYSYSHREIIRGIFTVAEQDFDYDVLLKIPMKEKAAYNYIKLFNQHKVDGVIVIFPLPNNPGVKELEEHGKNAVLVGGVSNKLDYIHVDNMYGTYESVKHFVDIGCKKIGIIACSLDSIDYQERLSAFKRALKERGCTYDKDLVVKTGTSETGGYEGMKKLLMHKPDAVFAVDDYLALGAIKAVKEAGLRIPEDISIVGFDDIPEASSTIPDLTTVHQPFFELGKEAANMLIARIRGKHLPQQKKTIPCKLILRGSTLHNTISVR